MIKVFKRFVVFLHKMGGFTLIGPKYIITNIPGKIRCRCTGFKGNIPLDIENILVNQSNKCLDLSVLPQDIRNEMLASHLGDSFDYKVTKRLTQEEKEAENTKWFSDMVDNRNNIYSEIIYTSNPSSMFEGMFETLNVDNQETTEVKLENLIKERNKVYQH